MRSPVGVWLVSRPVLRFRCELDPHPPPHQRPRATVYRALLDADAVETWMVPTGMTSHVHAFDPREGGAFRISLTYDERPIV